MESLLIPVDELKKPNHRVVYILLVVGIILLAGSFAFIVKNIFAPTSDVPAIQQGEQPTGVLYTSMSKTEAPLEILSYNFKSESPAFEAGITLPGATAMQFESSKEGISFFVFSSVAPDAVTGKRSSNSSSCRHK